MRTMLINHADRIRNRGQTDPMLDLMKLFGMFCVVYAHTFLHGLGLMGRGVRSSVYVIQLFIFCSGNSYRRSSDDLSPAFLRRLARNLLLPFFLWNLIYGALHEVLLLTGIIQFGNHLSLYTLLIQPWTNNSQFMLNQPSWFLLSLFEVTVITWLIRGILQKLGRLRMSSELILLGAMLILCAVAIRAAGDGRPHYGWGGAAVRTAILLPFYQLGILWREYGDRIGGTLRGILTGACAAVVLAPVLLDRDILGTKMLYCYFEGNPILLTLSALASVLLICLICQACAKLPRIRILSYPSRCTKFIMLHHLFWLWLFQQVLYLIHLRIPLPGYNTSLAESRIWYRYGFGTRWVRFCMLCAAFVLPILLHRAFEGILLAAANRVRPPSGEELPSSSASVY